MLYGVAVELEKTISLHCLAVAFNRIAGTNYFIVMDLAEYIKIKKEQEKIISNCEKVIKEAFNLCVGDNRLLSIGDRIEFLKDGRKYEIIGNPRIEHLPMSTKDNPLYDLVYTGLQIKSDGTTYLNSSNSDARRRDIYQSYLTRNFCVFTN